MEIWGARTASADGRSHRCDRHPGPGARAGEESLSRSYSKFVYRCMMESQSL